MTNSPIGKVYLIPTFLDEEALHTVPAYVLDAVKNCQVFFVENERSARRYLKKLWKEMVIDDYQWFAIDKTEDAVISHFKQALNNNKNIGIISEAGCPGVADPGQLLVAAAQQMGATVLPLVGPNSILLALMASGMNGQQFHFAGYLPIDNTQRIKMLKELEAESVKKKCTQIFIETPYRNNQLLETVCKTLQGSTRFCIACDITGSHESIQTKTVDSWKKGLPDIHKRPAIFLLYAG
jgi:16S rRNA (cytidine1402-2'-O)-methyltransferase